MFWLQTEWTPNSWLSPRRPITIAKLPNSRLISDYVLAHNLSTMCLLKMIAYIWLQELCFSFSQCLEYSYPWSSQSRMAFPDHPLTHPIHTLAHLRFLWYPAGHLLLSKIIAILQIIIHLSPLDCKLHEEKGFNPNLLLGPQHVDQCPASS